MVDNLVIIPTYNEKENIKQIIEKVFSIDNCFDVLVVDDGSPDGTGEIVRSLQDKYADKLFLEERSGKLGLGTAYIHGFKWGLQREKYKYFTEMDADFSHNPEDLTLLRSSCVDGNDLSIGSRYTKGGKVVNWPMNRWLMSYFASVYVRMILWFNVKDTTAGFICYKRKVLETLDLDNIKFIGYAFQVEMKYRAHRKKFKINEVPITFTDRVEGVSKMNTDIFKEAILGVLKMRFLKL
ncbi:MAG: dolichol-phosphate mannosyltransferase [Patiriisocius sp.]|jgi:dolichol-phosphate mannosyltransferase